MILLGHSPGVVLRWGKGQLQPTLALSSPLVTPKCDINTLTNSMRQYICAKWSVLCPSEYSLDPAVKFITLPPLFGWEWTLLPIPFGARHSVSQFHGALPPKIFF